MKHDKKILKFLRKQVANQASGLLPESFSEELGIELDELLVNLRHLRNLEYISAVNRPDYVGNLDMKDKVVTITSEGIVFLEQWFKEKPRFSCIIGLMTILAQLRIQNMR